MSNEFKNNDPLVNHMRELQDKLLIAWHARNGVMFSIIEKELSTVYYLISIAYSQKKEVV